jgi:hypothetical protein
MSPVFWLDNWETHSRRGPTFPTWQARYIEFPRVRAENRYSPMPKPKLIAVAICVRIGICICVLTLIALITALILILVLVI